MAQLALITELCQLEGPLPTGISLGRDRETFGCIPGYKAPSNGEILQVLALLGNIGHLATTFSGERAFLKYLRDHPIARRAFRLGLPQEDRAAFDRVLSSFDVYRLHYFVALFLLHRYRRRDGGEEIVAFCQSILRSFISSRESSGDEGVTALWRLYRSMRRLTYVALDSYYAPVPFSLDLASIFFSLKEYLSDVFIEGSAFHDALTRLEGVMQDTVYLAPRTLLNRARLSDSILSGLETREAQLGSITAHWDLLAQVLRRALSCLQAMGGMDKSAQCPSRP